jgi:hypothetical protein
VDRNVQNEMERKLWEKIAAGHGVYYAECGERYRHRICYGIADDAQRATQDAVDNGRCTDEQVETVFWSEYDCKYLEAVNALPPWRMTRGEFDALPVLDFPMLVDELRGPPAPHPPAGWFRMQMRGIWTLVHSDGIGVLIFKPEIEGVSLHH